MLTADQRTRYARHLLLAELGEAGQVRLCQARVRLDPAAHGRAAAVARDYLERAGMRVDDAAAPDRGAPLGALPAPAAVRALAGAPELEDAAAALAGAFAAVEAIKAAAGVGSAAALPDGYCLAHRASEEPAS